MNTAELTNITIDNNTIYVGNNHTTYFNETKTPKVDLYALLEDYKQLVKTAKSKGVKVGYTRGLKRRIEALKSSYTAVYAEYKENFFELKLLVESKVSRGIITPTSDDAELTDIYQKRNALQAMFYGNKPMSEARSLANDIKEMQRTLTSDSIVSIRL